MGAAFSPACGRGTGRGFFEGEIMPIEAEQGDGSMMVVDKDQAVRGDSTLEGLASLRPAFKKDGVIHRRHFFAAECRCHFHGIDVQGDRQKEEN